MLPDATPADVRGAVTAALNATSVGGTTTTVLVNGTHKSVTTAQPQDQMESIPSSSATSRADRACDLTTSNHAEAGSSFSRPPWPGVV